MQHPSSSAITWTIEPSAVTHSHESVATLAAESETLRRALADARAQLEFRARAMRLLMIPFHDLHER